MHRSIEQRKYITNTQCSPQSSGKQCDSIHSNHVNTGAFIVAILHRQISFADQVADRMTSNFKSTTETNWPSTPCHNVTLSFDMSTTQNFSVLPITKADPTPQGIDHATTEQSEDVSPEVSQARPNHQEQDPRSDLQENDPGIRGGQLRANATHDTTRGGPDHGCSEEFTSEWRYGISDCSRAGGQVSAAAFASTQNQGGDSIEEHEEESQEQDWGKRYTPVHDPGDTNPTAIVERYTTPEIARYLTLA